jgi:two-component system response regulator EvgA
MRGVHRVLLVDDHPWFRSMARTVLEGDRFVVVAEAASVAETLVALDAHRPDLVVLDVMLEDGTAFDVLAVMGAAMPSTVLVSSRAAEAYGDRMAEYGAVVGFLVKDDLDPDALDRLVAS